MLNTICNIIGTLIVLAGAIIKIVNKIKNSERFNKKNDIVKRSILKTIEEINKNKF